MYIQLGLQGETKMYDEGDKGRTEMLGQIVTILPVVALTVLCLCPLLVTCTLILGHCRGSSVLWETEKKRVCCIFILAVPVILLLSARYM